MSDEYKDKVVLVTGGGCRQYIRDNYHIQVAAGSSVGFAFNSGCATGKSVLKYIKNVSR